MKEIEVGSQGFYVVSDLHLNHERIIGYCSRPFSNVDEMNETLFNNWNNKVTDDDTIFFLGDFCNGEMKKSAKIVWDSLSGNKHFIKGNHDLWYEGIDIDETIIVKYKGKRIHLSHQPNLDFKDQYDYVVFGHIHNNPVSFEKPENFFNVSVEVIGYTPIHIDDLINSKR